MRVGLVLAFFIVIMSSCGERSEGFVIMGKIHGIADGSTITLYDIDQQQNLDSAFTANETFVLEGKVDEPTTCYIRNGDEFAIILVENVAITFESPQKDMLLSSIVDGGPEQDLWNELQDRQRLFNLAYALARDSLITQKYTDESDKKRLVARYNENQEAAQAIYVDFGMNHPNSHLGLDILYRNRNSIPRDSLLVRIQNLSPNYKGSRAALAIQTYLFERTVKLGEPCIDFRATTIHGKPFDLSSKRGKYVYLTFWSGGCGPCRMENKLLSKNKARIPELLSVVSFSVDRRVEDWRNASMVDGITWDNVSDLSGPRGTVKTQYEVQAVPASFLIDKEGIVIKRFTGFNTSIDIIEELAAIIKDHEEES